MKLTFAQAPAVLFFDFFITSSFNLILANKTIPKINKQIFNTNIKYHSNLVFINKLILSVKHLFRSTLVREQVWLASSWSINEGLSGMVGGDKSTKTFEMVDVDAVEYFKLSGFKLEFEV
eukprot:NODE_17_length_48642_cov_1.199349.p40 type:complete len:120 gc:universal NODE_17_length_48642_cov_1.199349:31608-31249(-)